MAMPQMKHQQKSVEVAPFSPFKSFLRHKSLLNLKLNAGHSYIDATNTSYSSDSTTVACKLLGNDCAET